MTVRLPLLSNANPEYVLAEDVVEVPVDSKIALFTGFVTVDKPTEPDDPDNVMFSVDETILQPVGVLFRTIFSPLPVNVTDE